MKARVRVLAGAIAAALLTSVLQAAEERVELQSIEIIGSPEDARQLPGSGAVVGQEQIRIEAATDINQLLKTVPGIYIREEDGMGLRPNIGVRAAGSDRSDKITLMEDGILVAPAPYSNPAADYFPTTLRMSSVEVLKGASLLRYGPQTTGGVVNLVATSIPEQRSGSVMAIAGENSSRDLHFWYGARSANGFGFLLETAQRDSEGFKEIDRSNRDSGYQIEDYHAKFGWRDERQELLLKLQYSEEVSNETYAGLTDADFAADPNRRYGLSSIDQMDNQHSGVSLRYDLAINAVVGLSATVYHNAFARDWFKLGGTSALINAANTGDANAQAVLDGLADADDLGYTHNNRSYESSGIQANLSFDLDRHQVELGGRIHEDEMDRFQPVEIYDQVNGSLIFDSLVLPTGSDNRLETAEAMSLWLTDSWQLHPDLNLNLALRYEDVDSSRQQFNDPQRSVIGSIRSNTDEQWLPGVSFTWDLAPSWQLLGGVHKGFSPLGGGALASEESETSINYEGGVRYTNGNLFLEAVGFYSDFSNKTENCSLASPCSNGATSGSFSTGEAVVSGLEFQVNHALDYGSWRIPLNLSYTLTQTEISKDNAVTGFLDGDALADIPENILSLRAGLEHSGGWSNYIVLKYIDSMCTNVACNRVAGVFNETESLLVLDLISRYQLASETEVFVKVENLLDDQEIISRIPDGARPNKPRTAMVGVRYSF